MINMNDKELKVAYVQYDATLATLKNHLEAYRDQFQDCDIIVVPRLGSIPIYQ